MKSIGYAQRDVRQIFNDMPVGRKQWTVLLICFAATAIEGFDTIVISFIAPAISQHWQLSSAALSPLVAFGLTGLLIGSIVGGTLADRVGRRTVSIVAIAWFGIAGVVSSEAQSIVQLIALRFVTGLGIGAAMPATSAIVAEYSPDRSRSAMLASTYCGFLFGAAAAGFVTSSAIGTLGWRGMLLLSGLLPLVVVALFAWQVPESPLYIVASRKSNEEAKRILGKVFPALDLSGMHFFIAETRESISGSGALLSGEYRLGTMLTWFAEFAGYLAFFLIGSWLPTHLKQVGLSMHDAAQVSSMFQFGALGGAVLFAILVRRYNVASVISAAFGVGSLLVIALGISETTQWHASVVFLSGIAVGGPLICVNTIPGIFYPTALRASGGGWNVAIGRLGSIVGTSLIGLIVISGFPYLLTCVLLSIPLFMACVCMTVMARVLSAQRRILNEQAVNISTVSAGSPPLPNSTTQ
ncbi:MFS transporter [Paraburkholderia elongata]|uniref:MFS transporter n=1 Tax=Paraburkholderia elongata TaxID=2675747 RepID=A0A972NW32_9BURK|nr:MFS transporter [Paraburkholderia elongata]NPT60166.1 MFS transporter [Paraburkholderia elongata]